MKFIVGLIKLTSETNYCELVFIALIVAKLECVNYSIWSQRNNQSFTFFYNEFLFLIVWFDKVNCKPSVRKCKDCMKRPVWFWYYIDINHYFSMFSCSKYLSFNCWGCSFYHNVLYTNFSGIQRKEVLLDLRIHKLYEFESCIFWSFDVQSQT